MWTYEPLPPALAGRVAAGGGSATRAGGAGRVLQQAEQRHAVDLMAFRYSRHRTRRVKEGRKDVPQLRDEPGLHVAALHHGIRLEVGRPAEEQRYLLRARQMSFSYLNSQRFRIDE